MLATARNIVDRLEGSKTAIVVIDALLELTTAILTGITGKEITSKANANDED